MAHYPKIRIRLQSRNPLALVAAIRQELRHAGVKPDEIQRFSDDALTAKDPSRLREVCSRWVHLDTPTD